MRVWSGQHRFISRGQLEAGQSIQLGYCTTLSLSLSLSLAAREICTQNTRKRNVCWGVVRACPALQGRGWNIPAPAISFPIGEEVVYSNISASRDTSATRCTANTAQCVHLSAASDITFVFHYHYNLVCWMWSLYHIRTRKTILNQFLAHNVLMKTCITQFCLNIFLLLIRILSVYIISQSKKQFFIFD